MFSIHMMQWKKYSSALCFYVKSLGQKPIGLYLFLESATLIQTEAMYQKNANDEK